MKRIIIIAAMVLSFSGCIGTKIYLGGEKKDITDEQPVSRAIDPTSVPAGGTWGTVRGILNTNFANINGTLDSVEVTLAEYGDSITNYSADIQLRLLKSDTTSMLANYTRNGELAAAIAGKLNVSDTATMLSPYALTSELGDAGTSIGDVRDEIADSLNVLRPLYVAVADTATMLDPYALLTDLSEGGISLSAVQDEIADSLNVLRPLVIMLADTTGTAPGSYVSGYTFQTGMSNKLMTADSLTAYVTPSQLSDSLATVEGGGVTLETVRGEISDSLDARIGAGIELSDVAVMIADSTGAAPGSYVSGYTFQQGMSNKVMIADSTGNAIGNYVTHKALNDSITANLGSAVGLTLNSGTLTLNGDGGTADDVTFYTNGDGQYDLPAGGGNLTIMSQVQGWINDSLDARIGDGVELSTIAVMKADSTGGPGHYATWYDMTTGLTSKVNVSDTTSMLSHYILASEVSSTYAPLSSPNFSGTPLLATSDTLATQAYARSYGGSGTVTTDDVEALITANARLNVDTIPLFVFGLGSGQVTDTAVFNNNALAGAFYNAGSDTLHITSIRGILTEGSGTETIGVQISWHATFKSGSATNLNASAYTITSITTGDEDTSFAYNEIPPGVWVWCTISGISAGNRPSMLILTMTGYKIRNW